MKNKKFRHFYLSKFWLILIGLFVFACHSDFSKKPISFEKSDQIAVNEFANDIRNTYQIPGLAFALVHQDSIFSNGIGIKNSQGDSLTSLTPILTGNLSEPLLAYAVLHLAKSGMIDLDDKVIHYLPYFKMGGDGYKLISIRNLLTHSSGIDHYTVFYDHPSFAPDALETTTRSIETQLPKWQLPEVQVLRSAYNYDILADLVAKVTGVPFEDYIRKAVFEPLHMDNADFAKPELTAQPFQTVNFLDYSYEQQQVYPYNRENGGSRGFHASAEDLGKWMFHILHERKSNYFNKELQTGVHSAVGFGWDIYRDESGIAIFTKNSEFGGFTSQTILIPELKIGVSVLANINNDFNSSKIAGRLVGWLKDRSILKLKAPVHLQMGKRFKETGQISSTLERYKTLKREKPDDYDFSLTSLLQLGMNLIHRENKPKEAIDLLRFSIREYPQSAKAMLGLAEANLKLGDMDSCRFQIELAASASQDTVGRAAMIQYLQEKMEIIEEKKYAIH